MKTIGLIGGMSWESTVPYYSIINKYINEHLGGQHSAKIVLYSVDFEEIEKCQSTGDWAKSADILSDAAKKLEGSDADIILICTNTMHKVYPEISSSVSVPVLHIAKATAEVIKKDGYKKVGLLGTKYTMKEDFYKSILKEENLDVIIPNEDSISIVNSIIFDELCHGIIKDDSRNHFSEIIEDMKNRGAEAVILGCTEIGLLVTEESSSLPIYDTTLIHATAAADYSLNE